MTSFSENENAVQNFNIRLSRVYTGAGCGALCRGLMNRQRKFMFSLVGWLSLSVQSPESRPTSFSVLYVSALTSSRDQRQLMVLGPILESHGTGPLVIYVLFAVRGCPRRGEALFVSFNDAGSDGAKMSFLRNWTASQHNWWAIQPRAIRAAYGFLRATRTQLLETSKLPRLEDSAKSMLHKTERQVAKWKCSGWGSFYPFLNIFLLIIKHTIVLQRTIYSIYNIEDKTAREHKG